MKAESGFIVLHLGRKAKLSFFLNQLESLFVFFLSLVLPFIKKDRHIPTPTKKMNP